MVRFRTKIYLSLLQILRLCSQPASELFRTGINPTALELVLFPLNLPLLSSHRPQTIAPHNLWWLSVNANACLVPYLPSTHSFLSISFALMTRLARTASDWWFGIFRASTRSTKPLRQNCTPMLTESVASLTWETHSSSVELVLAVRTLLRYGPRTHTVPRKSGSMLLSTRLQLKYSVRPTVCRI